MAGEAYKEHVAGLLKVIRASKIVKEDNIPCLIEDGLFLGSLGAANNKTALKALNVTHILTVAHSLIPSHPNDFVYKIIQVRDTEDVKLSQYFDECFAFIDEAKASGGGVLVHCFLGRSRSVTIIIAYLMFKHGMSLSEAVEHVRVKRPTMCPNQGFISQLEEYAKFLQVDAKNKDRAAHEPEKSGSSV
ncbi:dual specificity protein phosphatase 1-like isoform X1 [Salvia hispanica]|uniref:dual specificity protein phosphatase 1-like isoform X1 n=1 Tax=Salvia hispanica TaxID=49212 RepID=UPI002009523D|nr:dual specificity protein phosphatase 1-like isoform X1 [Salvia hispanica]XP_047977973.1 dual specificity protein phosphatase 1-like isoform X1 [Salvia hispanica]